MRYNLLNELISEKNETKYYLFTGKREFTKIEEDSTKWCSTDKFEIQPINSLGIL